MHWRCLKSVACFGRPFDPCEAERCVLIGWSCFALDLACSFYAISPQIHLHTYLDQDLWNSLNKHPILALAFDIIPFYCRI
jgi:hypothetical protein